MEQTMKEKGVAAAQEPDTNNIIHSLIKFKFSLISLLHKLENNKSFYPIINKEYPVGYTNNGNILKTERQGLDIAVHTQLVQLNLDEDKVIADTHATHFLKFPTQREKGLAPDFTHCIAGRTAGGKVEDIAYIGECKSGRRKKFTKRNHWQVVKYGICVLVMQERSRIVNYLINATHVEFVEIRWTGSTFEWETSGAQLYAHGEVGFHQLAYLMEHHNATLSDLKQVEEVLTTKEK
eukprot:GGOE01021424.1.p1 GENE.GGOE01021424.1~~GGOE01021424.1.p1  ORF type:complete len:270 (-),score=25.95 GGOE01021424.1:624-1331(-)